MTDGAGAGQQALADRLREGAAAMGLTLQPEHTSRMLTLSATLQRWNQSYNLTSIDTPELILTHHLLDSLSVHGDLAGVTVADAGTGAGFPGLPLAIVFPERRFTLIDSALKKLRFSDHMITELGLANVTTLHARVEQMKPERAFDTVLTRAFAPLPRLLQWVAPLCDANTRVIAMKGRWPPEKGSDEAGPLPPGWQLTSLKRVEVPQLIGERHVLRLKRAPLG